MLRTIGRLPLLGHVLGRLALLEHSVDVVVATTTLAEDDPIAAYCKQVTTACFRGSEKDVLDRYYRCASRYEFEQIIRLTADNPFTDIEEIDRLIDTHLQQVNAFTHSFGQLPLGVGAEIFSFTALERSWEEADEPHHREHVDEYFLENPSLFKTGILEISSSKRHPELRLTVDTREDLCKAETLVRQAGNNWLTTEQIIALCSASV